VNYTPSANVNNTHKTCPPLRATTTVDRVPSETMQPWVYADSRSNMSTVPLWFVSLNNLTAAKAECSSDYPVTIKLMDWFCISPLLVRDVPF